MTRCPYSDIDIYDCDNCQQFCEERIEQEFNQDCLEADNRADERKYNEKIL